jgi:hypothetical protein
MKNLIRRWRWLTLFLQIVWRKFEDERISVRTAADVTSIVHGTRPREQPSA